MVPTKLNVLCDRVIEAGWLVALVVTPLFFNVHSSRIFEPDKITLLRSIALMMVLAWIVKGLEGARLQKKSQVFRSSKRLSEKLRYQVIASGAKQSLLEKEIASSLTAPRNDTTPHTSQTISQSLLLLLALLFLADSTFASATSIAPRLSLWGSYERLQGLYTTAAYLVIFFSIVTLLRTEEQLKRLLTTVLVVSFPVSLYGIIQHFGIDPVPSVLHNPPLPLLRLAIYSVLLSAQLACIVLTQSRGPWLGLLSGLLLFAVLRTLTHRRWWWAMLITGSGLVVALLLAVIALPHSPLTFVRDVPYLGRFARVVEHTGQVRMLVWQGAVQLITANPVRTVIGYGPETMLVTSYPHYSPALSQVEHRTAFPDRSHNETFDVLVTTGLVGFMIYFLLFTGLFYYGLKGTGVIHSSAERRVFLGLWLAGGIGAILFARLLDHSWRFCGVALPLGMLGGLFAYLAWYGFSRFRARKQQDENHLPPCLILVPLLSVLAAHFSEITFGIAIAATRSYFWMYAALLTVAVHTRVPSFAREGQERGDPRSMAMGKKLELGLMGPPLLWNRPLIAHSLLVSLILITLVYAFLSPEINRTYILSIVWLFAATWVFAGLVILTERDVNPPSPPFAKGGKREARGDFSLSASSSATWPQALRVYGVYAGISLLGVLTFAAVSTGTRLLGSDPAIGLVTYYAFTLLSMLAIGGVLLLGERLPSRTLAGARGLVYPVLIAATLFVLFMTNVNVVRADIYYKQAWVAYRVGGQPDLALALGHRALELATEQDFYHFFLGDVLISRYSFDDSPNTLQLATRLDRGDAREFCNGNIDVGFAGLFNAGLLSPGKHTIHFRDDTGNIMASRSMNDTSVGTSPVLSRSFVISPTVNVVNFGEEFKTMVNPVAIIMQNQPMDDMTTELRFSVPAQGYQVAPSARAPTQTRAAVNSSLIS